MKRNQISRAPLYVRILCVALAVLMLTGTAYLTITLVFSALAL